MMMQEQQEEKMAAEVELGAAAVDVERASGKDG